MKTLLLSLFLLVVGLLSGRVGYAQQLAPPVFDFATAIGTVSTSTANEMSVNQLVPAGAGGYYLTGRFYGTVAFGTYTLTATGADDIFIAKVDASGAYQWAVKAGGTNIDRGNSLAVDGAGNVYVTGTFQSPQVTFGSITLEHQYCIGCDNTFVAKLSPTGSWLWAVQTQSFYPSGVVSNYANCLALDAAGNVYIAGQFREQKLNFGTITLTNTDPSLSFSNQTGQPDLYVAKLSPAGTWLWAVGGGGTNVDAASALALDPAGNVYVTGAFESTTAKFGPTTFTKSGYSNVVVAKLDGAGNWLWVTQAGGTAYCYSNGIAVDASGQVYLAGQFTLTAAFGTYSISSVGYYDAFVAKLSATGTWQWVSKCGSSAADRAFGIALDSQGSTYLAGGFLGPSIDVGPTMLVNTSINGYDGIIAKLNSQGTWQWVMQVNGDGDEVINTVALDAVGRVWLAGYFAGPAAYFGANTVTGNPVATRFGAMGFVARLSSTVLATQAPSVATAAFTLAPNPGRGTIWVRGLPARQAVGLYDIAGRLLLTAEAPATGTLQLALPAALPPGVYLVQSGGHTQRLVVD